jgi:hypothetical protein
MGRIPEHIGGVNYVGCGQTGAQNASITFWVREEYRKKKNKQDLFLSLSLSLSTDQLFFRINNLFLCVFWTPPKRSKQASNNSLSLPSNPPS